MQKERKRTTENDEWMKNKYSEREKASFDKMNHNREIHIDIGEV